MKGRTRTARVGWMAGALLPMLAGIGSAAGGDATVPQARQPLPQNQQMATPPGQTAQSQPQLESVKNPMGAKVVKNQSEQLGTTAQMIASEYIPALNYNPNALRTVQGTVRKVTTLPIEGTSQTELRLIVRADNGHAIEVDVGPLSYVMYQHVTFHPGDRVLIYGSLIRAHRRDILVAAQIRMPYQVLTLRTSEGTPLWNLNRSQMPPAYGEYYRPYAYPYGY